MPLTRESTAAVPIAVAVVATATCAPVAEVCRLENTTFRGPHGQERSLYSLRHSSITFRLLYGQGIDLLTLARNARTSVEVINNHYASTVTGEQNIALLQSRRTRQSSTS